MDNSEEEEYYYDEDIEGDDYYDEKNIDKQSVLRTIDNVNFTNNQPMETYFAADNGIVVLEQEFEKFQADPSYPFLTTLKDTYNQISLEKYSFEVLLHSFENKMSDLAFFRNYNAVYCPNVQQILLDIAAKKYDGGQAYDIHTNTLEYVFQESEQCPSDKKHGKFMDDRSRNLGCK